MESWILRIIASHGRTTENGMVEIDEEYSPRETAGKVFDQNENAN